MLYREITAVCSEIHTLHINAPRGHNAGDMYSCYCDFMGYAANLWHTSQCGETRILHCSKPSGHYMYRQFNIQQFYVLPTQCICEFCVDLRRYRHYFPIQQ